MFSKVGSDLIPNSSPQSIPIPTSGNNLSPRHKDRPSLDPELFVETVQQGQRPKSDSMPRVSFPEDINEDQKEKMDRISEKSSNIYPGANSQASDKSEKGALKKAMSNSDPETGFNPKPKHFEVNSDLVNKKRSTSAHERKPSSINHNRKDESDDQHLKGVAKFRHPELKLSFTNLYDKDKDKDKDTSSSSESMGRGDKTLPIYNRHKNKISPRSESFSSSPTSSSSSTHHVQSHKNKISPHSDTISSFSSSSPTSTSSSSTHNLPSQKKSPRIHRTSDSSHSKLMNQHPINSSKRRISVEDSTPRRESQDNSSSTYLKLRKINNKRNSDQKESTQRTNKNSTPARNKAYYFLPGNLLADHNACIIKSMDEYYSKVVSKETATNFFTFELDKRPVDMVYSDFDDCTFEINHDKDHELYNKLKLLIPKDELSHVLPVKDQVLNFCFESLYVSFLQEQMTFKDYRDYEPKHISKLLDIIQCGGMVLKHALPRLLLLREHLLPILSMEIQDAHTEFSVNLYKYIIRLTDLDKFSVAEKGFEKGKSLSGFVQVMDEMLEACKELKVKYPDGGGKAAKLKLTSSSNSKIELTINPIKELLLTALGGSVEKGLELLEELRFWSIPGQGGISESSTVLYEECLKTALYLDSVQRIFRARHYCFIENRYSADTKQDPEGKYKSLDIQGVSSVFISSYAKDSIDDVCRSLKQERCQNINAGKIIVKGASKGALAVVVHDDSGLTLSPDTDPLPNFWTVLIASFYRQGFGGGGKVSSKIIEKEASDLRSFYEDRELIKKKDKNGELIDLYKKIPTLKILELMTVKCYLVSGKYLQFLFPKLYTPYGCQPTSPYFMEDVKKSWEINVKIINANDFKVTHKKKFDIFTHANRRLKICTVSYSWTNRPAVLENDTDPLSNINGWEGELKLTDFEFFETSHSKDIMDIFSKPNDVSSRTDLPPGLRFSSEHK